MFGWLGIAFIVCLLIPPLWPVAMLLLAMIVGLWTLGFLTTIGFGIALTRKSKNNNTNEAIGK